MLVQNIVLLLLIYSYQGRSSSRTAGLFAILAGWGGILASGAMQPSYLNVLYDFNNILLLASRVPQIYQNYSNKSTGQLSIVTYALNLAGASARIFTTLQQKNAGTAMLRGAMLSKFFFFDLFFRRLMITC
jgi:mannose-P-dolichol utilization defect protein 1